MRVLNLSAITALAQSVAICIAIPVEFGQSLAPRSQSCGNAPSTVAGTMLDGVADNLELNKRVDNVLWCCPGTQTYITLALTHIIPPGPLWTALYGAYQSVYDHVHDLGDGLLADGAFTWAIGPQVVLSVWNADNHQTTWGVLGSALYAIADYFHTYGIFAAGTFDIYDGPNQVGSGSISWY